MFPGRREKAAVAGAFQRKLPPRLLRIFPPESAQQKGEFQDRSPRFHREKVKGQKSVFVSVVTRLENKDGGKENDGRGKELEGELWEGEKRGERSLRGEGIKAGS